MLAQRLQQRLWQSHLYAVCHTGVFACGFEATTAVHPGLKVEGVGVVALPLQPEQAKAIQACCKPAPFGRGEETVWDPAVRSTWQLPPDNISFNNPGKAPCHTEKR